MCNNCQNESPNVETFKNYLATFGEGTGQDVVIPILQKMQDLFGYIPEPMVMLASQMLRIPQTSFYGTATFYSQFSLTPKGKHAISVCLGTACYVKGSNDILLEFERLLGIKDGETTADGLFSLDNTRCVGACGLAPVVTVGEKIYGHVKASDVELIIGSLGGAHHDAK